MTDWESLESSDVTWRSDIILSVIDLIKQNWIRANAKSRSVTEIYKTKPMSKENKIQSKKMKESKVISLS